MYVYMYIYVYVYIYIYTHTYTHIYIYNMHICHGKGLRLFLLWFLADLPLFKPEPLSLRQRATNYWEAPVARERTGSYGHEDDARGLIIIIIIIIICIITITITITIIVITNDYDYHYHYYYYG